MCIFKRMADLRSYLESIDIVAPADGFHVASEPFSPGRISSHENGILPLGGFEPVWVGPPRFYEQGRRTVNLLAGWLAQYPLEGEGRQMPGPPSLTALPQSEAGGGTVKLSIGCGNPQIPVKPEMVVGRRVARSVYRPTHPRLPLGRVVDSGAPPPRFYIERGKASRASRGPNGDGVFGG